jgi:hypothetical protein
VLQEATEDVEEEAPEAEPQPEAEPEPEVDVEMEVEQLPPPPGPVRRSRSSRATNLAAQVAVAPLKRSAATKTISTVAEPVTRGKKKSPLEQHKALSVSTRSLSRNGSTTASSIASSAPNSPAPPKRAQKNGGATVPQTRSNLSTSETIKPTTTAKETFQQPAAPSPRPVSLKRYPQLNRTRLPLSPSTNSALHVDPANPPLVTDEDATLTLQQWLEKMKQAKLAEASEKCKKDLEEFDRRVAEGRRRILTVVRRTRAVEAS